MGFRAATLTNPDKPAIVMLESGETVSYGELSDRADQYANFFRLLGFEAGDCIAFTLENCPSFSQYALAPCVPDLAAELIAYCQEHLSPIKCPKSIDFMEALPRHATGKLYKRLLKDQYWGADANPP